MSKYILTVAFLSLMCFAYLPAAYAQQHTFRYRHDVKIVIDSDTIKHPWTGGLNSPVFSRIDLDQDGVEDLYAFDRTHQKSYTFLARQQQGAWAWEYAPSYEYLFPADLSGWVLLRDYDRDGRRDIFTHTSLGIKVYRNTSCAAGRLTFAEAESYLKFGNNINLQASSENLPAIGDMDQDGDLDVLLFNFATSTSMEYYQNLQQEENLPAGRFRYALVTQTWGGLVRCHSHSCHAYVFGGACRTEGTNHNAGTTLLALDLDGDGDQDILLGSESCAEVARGTNSGTAGVGLLRAADITIPFPASTTPGVGISFPAAYYEDVSFDGLPDLLVAPFARSNVGDGIDFAQSSWYYQNTGSTRNPDFAFRQHNFLQDQMVDVGELSAPALGDVDGDGDADLLVGTCQGSIWFFRNTGTAAKAVFQLENRDYEQLSVVGMRDLRPLLTDLNADGRLDLVLAGKVAGAGTISYIRNAAVLGQAARFPAVQRQALLPEPAAGGAPAFFDLDSDGDKDLVLAGSLSPASESGTLQFYRNTGSRSNPVFTLENADWGQIPLEFNRPNGTPVLADLNRDNQPELLLADDTGQLRVYSDIRRDFNEAFSPVTDIFQYPGTQAYGALRLGGSVALAAADLDGDQIPELVAGSLGGGLVLLGQETANTGPLPPVTFNMYPNPAGAWVKVQSEAAIIASVRNIAGQLVIPFGSTFRKVQQIDLSGLSTGLYLVQVRTADHKQTSHKLVVNKY